MAALVPRRRPPLLKHVLCHVRFHEGSSDGDAAVTFARYDRCVHTENDHCVSASGRSDGLAPRRRIALVAHDNKKDDLLEWAHFNRDVLARHALVATGTTGRRLGDETGLCVTRFHSGPLGGDLQIGSRIVDGEIDLLLFFWDPLEPQPHDPDVKALLRIAVVWNVPVACNRSTADYLISSPLLRSRYDRTIPTYADAQ